MKILLSLRSDALKVFGGDIQYARELEKILPSQGIKVAISVTTRLVLSGIDAVNIVNVINLEETAQKVSMAKAQKIPVILTPEYANLDRFFLHTHWKANIARLTLGEEAALVLFRAQKRLRRSWRLLRWVMRSVDHLVAKSEWEKEQLLSDFRLPANRISVAKNGVDPRFGLKAKGVKFIRRFGVENFLLTVGRVEPIKNQLSLLRATEGLDVPVVFIGGGYTASNSYLFECKKLGKGHPVHFIDRLSHEELADALAAARAHVAPSFAETTSLVSLEAVLAGCPVVITKESPYQEYLGKEVVTCDPYDVTSIRRAVERVLSRPQPVQSMRQHLIKELAWPNVARELATVYRRVLHGK